MILSVAGNRPLVGNRRAGRVATADPDHLVESAQDHPQGGQLSLYHFGTQTGATEIQTTILQAWFDIEFGIGPVADAPAIADQIGKMDQDGTGRSGRAGWRFVMSTDRCDD